MTMPAGIEGIPGIEGGDWAEAVVTTANVNKAKNVSRRNIEHLLGNVGGVYSTLVASRHLEFPTVGAVDRRTLHMRTTRGVCVNVVALVIVVLLATGQSRLSAQQTVDPAIRPGANDLGGVVTSVKGPEAGVWVIAETTDLPTKFAKIVVTDDLGRYLIPDLPKVGYKVWVRGYGLIDSPKIRTSPGKVLNLRAVTAPSPAAAAEYYPAIYWYSMLEVPDKSEFPIAAVKSQAQWLDVVKTNGCYTCHQLGNKATRTIPKELGPFDSSVDAWQRRIQSGQAMIQAIVDAGFILQIDDPGLGETWDMMIPAPPLEEYRRMQARNIDALNHALAGIPEERVRYHLCWGSWQGPHVHDLGLRDIVDLVLRVKAQAYSIEAATPRHAYEWRVWEDVNLPDGKLLIPGVIAHTTAVVEHPETVTERITNFARLVGRERVIAGVDCGFAQGALYQRQHPSVMWAKFEALVAGARLASDRLRRR